MATLSAEDRAVVLTAQRDGVGVLHGLLTPAELQAARRDFERAHVDPDAVWALMDYGFKVVLSSRFADIFRGNSGKAGLLSVPVEQDVIEQLWAAIEDDPTTRITVDLEARTVTCGDLVAPFQIDDYTRWRLLNGLDDIGITLGNEADIAAFEATRPSFKPVTQ